MRFMAAALSIMLAMFWVVPSARGSSGPFGPAQELAAGTQPHCATGADGTLHIVFKSSGIRYMTFSSSGAKSAVELIPGSANAAGSKASSNPWVCVAPDGSVHVVWDTWSKAYYSNRIGGSWKTPLTLPQIEQQRNYFAQVSGGYSDEVHVSTWNFTKNAGQNNSFYRITQTSSATPSVKYLRKDPNGKNRPPSVLGPTASAAGDGRVHAAVGNRQTTHKIIEPGGGFSGGTNISRTPSGKTVEGCQLFFIGSDVGFVTMWWNGKTGAGHQSGAVANTLSRAQAGKSGLVAGISDHEFTYPRAAYDPVNRNVYVLFPSPDDKPAISAWDPTGTAIRQLGTATSGTLSTGTRGRGAGGIAPRKGGGAHVVYSTGGKVFHRTIDAGSNPPQPINPGDANEDGSVGMADLNTLVDWILGRMPKPNPGEAAFTNSDVDGSMTIDMADLNLLVDFILGRIMKFPVES